MSIFDSRRDPDFSPSYSDFDEFESARERALSAIEAGVDSGDYPSIDALANAPAETLRAAKDELARQMAYEEVGLYFNSKGELM